MFNFTYELITLAASNPHLIFLFCNLIIGILIAAGSDTTSNSDDNHTATPIPPPRTATNIIKTSTPRAAAATSVKKSVETSPPLAAAAATNFKKSVETSTPTAAATAAAVGLDVNKESYVSKEAEDDELRKRVEEFIDKINRGWKAEKLRASPLVHQLNMV